VARAADPQVGERIRAERTKRGVSLRSLARGVGVSASLISQIETGKCQPSVSTLYAITTTLGVSIEDVFEPAGPPPDGLLGAAAAAVSAAPLPRTAPVAGAGIPAGSSAGAVPPRITPPHTVPPRMTPPDAMLSHITPPDTAPPDTALPHLAPSQAVALAALAAAQGSSPVARAGEREVLRLDSGVTWERLGHVPGVQVDFLLVTYAPGGSSSGNGQLMRHTGAEYGYLMQGELILTLAAVEQRLTAGQSVSFPSSTPHSYRNDAACPAVGVWFVAG